MTSDGSPHLVVETGVHRTARCRIRSGRHGVGPEPEDAIVVSDLSDGFVVDRRPQGVYLCAAAVPIDLFGGRQLKPGRERRCTETTRFSCGRVAFRLDVPPAARPRAGWVDVAKRFFGFAGGVLATATVCAVVLSRAAPYSLVVTPSAVPPGIAAAPLAIVPSGPVGMASLARDLRAHLDSLGLQSVTIATQSDGALEVKGEISPQDETVWHDIGRWFDAKAKGRAVLVDSVRVVAIAPPLVVRAVWTGRNPYVVDGDGERLFVGSVLPTGWVVDAIEGRRVVMRHGGHVVSVRY